MLTTVLTGRLSHPAIDKACRKARSITAGLVTAALLCPSVVGAQIGSRTCRAIALPKLDCAVATPANDYRVAIEANSTIESWWQQADNPSTTALPILRQPVVEQFDCGSGESGVAFNRLAVASRRLKLPKLTALHEEHKPLFDEYRVVPVGASLATTGVVLMAVDKRVRTLRNSYVSTFKYKYDNYLQYSPAAIMYGVKAAGVDGMSSWGRMLTADVMSAAITTAIVNGLKYTVRIERPDHSKRNSFPSGHTATAFMTATLLHHEYGLTRSPFYSTIGYALATATAVSRIMNNRHWLSDVVAGAGIGILSAEAGYWINSKIWKQAGLKSDLLPRRLSYEGMKPSFVGLTVGGIVATADLDELTITRHSGMYAAVEGAWFITEHAGIGAQIRFAHPATLIDGGLLNKATTYKTEDTRCISNVAGCYISFPLDRGLFAGGKMLIGVNRTLPAKTTLYDQNGATLYTIDAASRHTFTATTGLSLLYVVNYNFGIRFTADYNYLNYFSIATDSAGNRQKLSKFVFPLSVGIALNAMLW